MNLLVDNSCNVVIALLVQMDHWNDDKTPLKHFAQPIFGLMKIKQAMILKNTFMYTFKIIYLRNLGELLFRIEE